MSVDRHIRRAAAAAFLIAAGAALAGCGGPAGSVAAEDSAATKFGNLLAFNSTTAPAGPGRSATTRIECPLIQIEPGASAYRAGGEDSSSVRYQISIGDVARECSNVNGQLLVRVGVETRTVLGPAGAPGSYTAPLRVSMRRTGDEKVLDSKSYRVGGAVGSSGASISSLIVENLSAPYINERAVDDYEIVLALGQGDAPAREPRRRRRH